MKALFSRRRARPSYRRNPPRGPRGSADEVAAHELVLFITNDRDLYHRQAQPIIANLRKKHAKGVFDRAKAVKLFGYLAKSGADKYAKEYGGSPSSIFNVPTRNLAAKELEEHYREEVGYKSNPSTSAPTYYVIAGKGFGGEHYVFVQDARGMVARNPLNAKRFRSKDAAKRYLDSASFNKAGLFVARIRRFAHGISIDK